MTHSPAVWLPFAGVVLLLLILDLGVLNRRSHVLSTREALAWSGGLVTLALLFGGHIWWQEGAAKAVEFYTGYVVELTLSVDNLFVFLMVFQYFSVPAAAQPKVLKWGIVGALVMRAIMIGAGALLLSRFHWITYVFGAILVLTGLRMLAQSEEQLEPEKNPLVRLARKLLPLSPAYDGASFSTRTVTGKLVFTPLLIVVLVVEWTDLVFAVDSIPAVFAITQDPFIVYSSNIFAILGLRALFFLLAGAMDKFTYLKPGVALILLFVGAKMVLTPWIHVTAGVSLAVIVSVLALAVVASLVRNRREAGAVAG